MSRFRALLACGAIACSVPKQLQAQAGTYWLNSASSTNAIDVTLLTGSWTFGVSAGAWSPWNYVSECDAGGNNCHTGFHTVFYYALNGGPTIKHGWDGSERERYSPVHISDFYSSVEGALAHAFAPVAVTVDAPTTLRLFIPDCCYWDNVGGLDIRVQRVETPSTVVPEPSSVALLAFGLAGVGAVARRKRQ